MTRSRSISPLLLFGTTVLLLGTAACIFLTTCFGSTDFPIDMSDEDGNEYS